MLTDKVSAKPFDTDCVDGCAGPSCGEPQFLSKRLLPAMLTGMLWARAISWLVGPSSRLLSVQLHRLPSELRYSTSHEFESSSTQSLFVSSSFFAKLNIASLPLTISFASVGCCQIYLLLSGNECQCCQVTICLTAEQHSVSGEQASLLAQKVSLHSLPKQKVAADVLLGMQDGKAVIKMEDLEAEAKEEVKKGEGTARPAGMYI